MRSLPIIYLSLAALPAASLAENSSSLEDVLLPSPGGLALIESQNIQDFTSAPVALESHLADAGPLVPIADAPALFAAWKAEAERAMQDVGSAPQLGLNWGDFSGDAPFGNRLTAPIGVSGERTGNSYSSGLENGTTKTTVVPMPSAAVLGVAGLLAVGSRRASRRA